MLLLTGYGSIGSLIIKELLRKDPYKDIIIIDKSELAIHQARNELRNYINIHCFVIDITNKRNYDVLRQYRIDAIIHTAALKHVTFCEQNPTLAVYNNIDGLNNLLDFASNNSVTSFINVSTDKSAYPVNVMGATKFIAEKLVALNKYKSVRLGNVLNSNGSLVPTLLKFIDNNQIIDITDLNATRFYITPQEVASYIVQLSESLPHGDIFIKKIKSATLDVMLNSIFQYANKNCEIKITGLRPGEKMHEHLYTKTEISHMTEYDNQWIIDFSVQSNNDLQIIDSSQFCVTQEVFYNDLLQSFESK